MFKKLHFRLTFLSTAITGIILVAMSIGCLSIAENGVRKNYYATFLNGLNSVLAWLDGETLITHEWLSQMENTHQMTIYLEDNGTPLLFSKLKASKENTELIAKAKAYAQNENGMDLTRPQPSSLVPVHTEFSLTDSAGNGYYASAAQIRRENGSLLAIFLYPLAAMEHQLFIQRLLFGLLDVCAVLLLFVFSWFFTGRTLRPIEESRQEQTAFVAAASHELRTPLAVILSSISAMEKAEETERPQFLGIIASESRRMARLVGDLLSLASADNHSWSIRLLPEDADTLLLNAYEAFEPLAKEKGQKLFISLPEDSLKPCVCDKERIAQLLGILIQNALSYTPEGGIIRLSLTACGDRLRFSVTDNGPGIPDSQKKLIFRRFYRMDAARNKKDHFGLGLCIAREIAELHKGQLTVADAPGGGAVFTLTLPLQGPAG